MVSSIQLSLNSTISRGVVRAYNLRIHITVSRFCNPITNLSCSLQLILDNAFWTMAETSLFLQCNVWSSNIRYYKTARGVYDTSMLSLCLRSWIMTSCLHIPHVFRKYYLDRFLAENRWCMSASSRTSTRCGLVVNSMSSLTWWE